MTNREFYEQLIHRQSVGHRSLTPLQNEWLTYYLGSRFSMSWQEMQEFDRAELKTETEYGT